VILNEERTSDEEKMKIIEGQSLLSVDSVFVISALFAPFDEMFYVLLLKI